MFYRQRLIQRRQDLPSEIYISLVGSLFSDPRTLFAGSVGAIVAAFVTAFKTGETSLWICTAAIAILAYVRGIDMRAFARVRSQLTADDASRWEIRYIVGSAAHVSLLGIWCL